MDIQQAAEFFGTPGSGMKTGTLAGTARAVSASDLRRISESNPVVLFDGVCNFCVGSVRFIINRDPNNRFRFASLQSDAGSQIAEGRGMEGLVTLMLLENGRLHARSGAALRIAAKLRFPWSLAAVFLIVPRFVRDAVYNVVARNRYKWFGVSDECMIPTPEIRERFLT